MSVNIDVRVWLKKLYTKTVLLINIRHDNPILHDNYFKTMCCSNHISFSSDKVNIILFRSLLRYKRYQAASTFFQKSVSVFQLFFHVFTTIITV